MSNNIGDIKYSLQTNNHSGWLLCDGRTLFKNDHSDLYNFLSNTIYRINDNVFKLPDCRGRILANISINNNNIFGTTKGYKNVTLNNENIPNHTHNGYTKIDGVHSHGMTDLCNSHNHNGSTADSNIHGHVIDPNTYYNVNTDDNFGTANLGSSHGKYDDYVNPNVESYNGPHIHNIANDGLHNHGINYDADHNHSFTTDFSGNSESHNNMQPTIYIGNIFIYSKNNNNNI